MELTQSTLRYPKLLVSHLISSVCGCSHKCEVSNTHSCSGLYLIVLCDWFMYISCTPGIQRSLMPSLSAACTFNPPARQLTWLVTRNAPCVFVTRRLIGCSSSHHTCVSAQLHCLMRLSLFPVSLYSRLRYKPVSLVLAVVSQSSVLTGSLQLVATL